MFRRKFANIRYSIVTALVCAIVLSLLAPGGGTAGAAFADETGGGSGEVLYVPLSQCTATASSVHIYNPQSTPDKAIDDNLYTQWMSNDPLQQWITVDLGDTYDVTQLKIYNGPYGDGIITDYEVWVGADGTNFTEADSGTWNVSGNWYQDPDGKWRKSDFTPISARYVKLVANAALIYFEASDTYEARSHMAVGELQVGYTEGGAGEAKLTGIEITSPPNKTTYEVGESFVPDGLVVTAAYDDGTSRVLTAGEYTLSGFDSSSEGTKTVTVTYQGLTASFEVTVEEETPVPEGRTTVLSPAYRAEISGDTLIEFVCPGGTTASVYAQKQPDDLSIDSNGTREAIGGIITLENGYGSATFPADEYPDGPVTLRIRVWKDGADFDDSYLQLYNTSGVQWKKGLENAPMNPVTEGMEVAFYDDFKTMPAISFSGEGATYASVKPDVREGGQFGYAAFEDFGGSYDPFAIADGEYMKITTTFRGDGYTSPNARWHQKATTGFLSSMAMDGSGFHTQGGKDQYFEARIFCPPTPGMWPAFWTLTANNYADNPLGNGTYACDELDILEGYMAWPDRYSIAWHPWSGTDEPNPTANGGGSWPSVDTEQTGYINLAMGFHIFGMHITEETTYYYFDNVEVASHPTMQLSWELGNYFMINGAVSDHVITDVQPDGSYSYANEFFRYGNENNMYIDWVRVYEETSETPRFRATASTVRTEGGEEMSVTINRNAAAQGFSGSYEIEFPGEGWEFVSGTSFSAGSETDTIILRVPGGYTGPGIVSITPVAGETRFPVINITVTTPSAAEIVEVNANTYPYRSGTATEGAWINYNNPNEPEDKSFSFNFGLGGNWWSDSWGWMYTGSGGVLDFKFEGTSIALYVYKGDYGGDTEIYLDGVLQETVDTYSPSDINEKVFERTGLPVARHTLRIRNAGAQYIRISGFTYTYEPAPAPEPPADIITLISPKYRADISGDTVLEFVFPGGYSEAEAYSLATGAGDAASLGGPVALDGNGRGSIAFDADLLPHGPVAVRVIATKADGVTKSIDNYLQFYNEGGAVADTGLENTPMPAQIADMDMELLFADDFKTMPSISRDGTDAQGNPTTYIAHKPDYGDYGGAQFADFEGPNNPFHQVDDYLRITTAYDEDLQDGYGRKYYTGFLASVDRQGEGIWTDGYVNQYFEARFFTGANPSLWPAFWTLSNKQDIGSKEEPCDEMDIIEGYMAWPDSYSIACHPWGAGHPQSGQGGGCKVPTEERYGQKGNIAMGFHTYGMLITEDVTYFYFDNELVFETPTLYYSWTAGNYFMINNALSDHSFPEGYGFERYGDASHMYIDWVRVYQQPSDPNAVRFTAATNVREVRPGDTLEVVINRSPGAQALSGYYDVELPDGWTLVSGNAFQAGNASDTLTFRVDEDCVVYSAGLDITPMAGGVAYRTVTIPTLNHIPFNAEIYPVLNDTGDGWEVAVKLINGHETAAVPAGYVEVTAPADAAGQYPFEGIAAGGSAVVKLPGTSLTLLGLTDYVLDVVRPGGYRRTYERKVSNLTAVRKDAPIAVDGIAGENEWEGATEIVLGADAATNYNAGRPWGGENDSSAVGRLKWDDEYLYLSVVVRDDIHFQESPVTSSWGSDSLQFSIDQGRAAGYNAENHTRFISALNSVDGSYGLAVEYKGALPDEPSDSLCVNRRDEAAGTTTYELALKWSEILPADLYPPRAGVTDIGFAFMVNENDGDAYGRVGWLSYMGGIGYGKDAREFGDLILTDRNRIEEP